MIVPTCPKHGSMTIQPVWYFDEVKFWVWACKDKDCDECAGEAPTPGARKKKKNDGPVQLSFIESEKP